MKRERLSTDRFGKCGRPHKAFGQFPLVVSWIVHVYGRFCSVSNGFRIKVLLKGIRAFQKVCAIFVGT